MGDIEELVARYKTHIAAAWQKNLAGAEKTIFVVYPKTEERRLRARLELFEMATTGAGHGWLQFDFTPVFAKWMAATDYREEYFQTPADLNIKLETNFLHYAAEQLRQGRLNAQADGGPVLAALGVV